MFLFYISAIGQWAKEPHINTPICVNDGHQWHPKLISDEAGNIIFVWSDDRLGTFDIYAQRMDMEGNLQWALNGIPIVQAPVTEVNPIVILDGKGGFIVAWRDDRDGYNSSYIQRVDPTGKTLWKTNGIEVSKAPGEKDISMLLSDDNGGAIFAWSDRRSGNSDIYVQRIDGDGNMLWANNGVPISTASGNQVHATGIKDSSNNVILTWVDNRRGNPDVFAQRIDVNGKPQWLNDGIPIIEADGYQTGSIISDGVDGGIIIWLSMAGTGNAVYIQRINADGKLLWSEGGILAAQLMDVQYAFNYTADENGGVIIAWLDKLKIANNIYAQRFDSNGEKLWNTEGVPITLGIPGKKSNLRMTTDGSGGAIIMWADDRQDPKNDIYAQKIDTDGDLLWLASGLPVSVVKGYQGTPIGAPTVLGGVVIIWSDRRGGSLDIYGQQISSGGVLGKIAK